MSCGGGACGPHGIGSAARMTAVRRYEGPSTTATAGTASSSAPATSSSARRRSAGRRTQIICALLILQEPELPLPLDTLSPWIDMVTRARTEVFADLAAQTHRRFLKTHTPLDGIPNDPTVTYVCVGRDPRDVAVSMDHHIDNTDISAFLNAHKHAAAIDGIELGPLPTAAAPRRRAGPLLAVGRRRDTLDAGRVVAAAHRRPPADLSGRRRKSRRRVPALRRPEGRPRGADAAARRAPRNRGRRGSVAPSGPGGDVRVDAQQGRHDRPLRWSEALDRSARFFSRGTSGQSRDLLDDTDLARYATHVRALASNDLVEWVHRDPID